jgi:hypothetical protein
MLYRMAIKCLLPQLLIWISIYAATATSEVTFDEQVSGFIPSCAQDCLKTFIKDNGLVEHCGTTPSLQCLCSHETPTGLSIGEAAVECIFGSADFTTCCPAGTVNSMPDRTLFSRPSLLTVYQLQCCGKPTRCALAKSPHCQTCTRRHCQQP